MRNGNEDYIVRQEVEKATTINRDQLVDHFLHGTPIPSSGPAGHQSGVGTNESSSLFQMDTFGTAMQVLGAKGINQALDDGSKSTLHKNASAEVYTGPSISQRQWKAIQKFPSLIEFLGSEHGDQIANEVASKVTALMVTALGDNAKKLSKYAYSCENAGGNIKQFFVNEDGGWVCQVTANGPFRGDEALYYNHKRNKAYVLRLRQDKYEDVSEEFNVIHEMAHKGE